MKNVTIAQVGCGYWGPNLIRAFRDMKGTTLKSLCDARTGRLQWALGEFPGLLATTELADLLTDPEVDAVAIATEPVTHYALGRAVLDAGKHLFMEKPLAVGAREAEDLARRAKAKRLVIGVGFVYLHHPAILALRAALTPKKLGKPLYLDLARVNPGPPRPKHSVIWDLAPHEASLAVVLAGARPVAVRATGLRWGMKVLEAALIEARFANGVVARIHASWMGHGRVRRLDAYCEKGAAYFDETADIALKFVYPGLDNRAGGRGAAKTLTYGEPIVEIPYLPGDKPLGAECAAFVNAVRQRQDPEAGAALGVTVSRLLHAAERSAARGGQEIKL